MREKNEIASVCVREG